MARSLARAEHLEERLDGPVVVAAVVALVAVVLQVAQHHGPWHTLGLTLSWAVWAVFALDAAVLLAVHPAPGRWARGHWFELLVLVVAFPLWSRVLPGGTGTEVAPAFDLLKAAKLAKVVKAARLVHYRGRSRALGVVVVVLALAVFVFVLAAGGH